jgi:flagellin
MAISLNTNLTAISTQRSLSTSQSTLAISLNRLSSGLRINRAQDDAAGLAISSRLSSKINGTSQSIRNANDGISMLQTAEGAMSGISDSLQRMRELSVQAANAPVSSTDRKLMDDEVQQLSAEIQRIASSTHFNNIHLLDGSFSSQSFYVGAGDAISISSISNMQTSHLGSTGSSFEALLKSEVVTASLSAGDLLLNNVSVNGSTLGAAAGQTADSAFAIAAAINETSATSGVSASASTKITSAAPSSFSTIAAFSINGVDIGSVSAGTDASSQSSNLASAITGFAAQTGVTASASAGIVTMSAVDGRNINIGLNGTVANAAAAAANKAAFLSQTGLAAGAVGSQGTSAVAAQNTFNIAASVGVGAQFVVNGISFTVRNSALASAVVDASHIDLNIPGASNNAATVSSALSSAISMAQGNGLTSAALGAFSVSDGGGSVVLNDNTPGASSTSISRISHPQYNGDGGQQWQCGQQSRHGYAFLLK